MKPKLIVFVVALLIVAMVPALAMAAGQAKPQRTVRVTIDVTKPLGPQLDAQLGVTSKGVRAVYAPGMPAPRANNSVQPNAVYALLNTSFEAPNWPSTSGNADGFQFAELGLSWVGWDSTFYRAKRGQQSLYSAGYFNDPFVYPFYENDMESYAYYPMDLTGARRVQARFQYRSDTEFGYDYFLWCSSDDYTTFLCDGHTGSTNGTWRLVTLDSRNSTIMADLLNEPFASFLFIFVSDYSNVDEGTYVDAFRIRAWGP